MAAYCVLLRSRCRLNVLDVYPSAGDGLCSVVDRRLGDASHVRAGMREVYGVDGRIYYCAFAVCYHLEAQGCGPFPATFKVD